MARQVRARVNVRPFAGPPFPQANTKNKPWPPTGMAAMTTGAKRSAGWPRRPRSVVSMASIPPETKDTGQRRVYSTPAKMGSWPIWPTRRSLPRLSAHAQACSMDQSWCTPLGGFSTVPRPKRGYPWRAGLFLLGCGPQATGFPDSQHLDQPLDSSPTDGQTKGPDQRRPACCATGGLFSKIPGS